MIRKIVVIIVLVFILVSCRKGENDPLVSLLSRKARLTGSWQLKEMVLTSSFVHSSGRDSIFEETYFNQKITTGVAKNIEWEYIELLDINSNGSFKKDMNYGIVHFIEEGNWYFAKRSNEGNIKNKEMVVFEKTKEYKLDDEEGIQYEISYSGHQSSNVSIEMLDGLRNNEMNFIYSSSDTNADKSTKTVSGYKLYLKTK